jgi:hypothetical protein
MFHTIRNYRNNLKVVKTELKVGPNLNPLKSISNRVNPYLKLNSILTNISSIVNLQEFNEHYDS